MHRILPSGPATSRLGTRSGGASWRMPICYRWLTTGPEILALMKMSSIQYFVQVADEGSITRTADKIGSAQPALTRHIKQLEAELGTQLLMRLPRGVRLTTSGRDFLEHARAIMLEVSRASKQVRSNAEAPQGK